jgi:tRNA(Ile)-lysidine synthase
MKHEGQRVQSIHYNGSMAPDMHARKVLIARVQSVLTGDCGLDPRLPLVAGFSGGADSLCLLSLLAELGWQVSAAHFDHHLRAESGRDAERAADMALRLGVPFVLGGGAVAELARGEKLSIEEAARKLRYGFLFDAARRLGAQAVCTAHTADDQAETVLMHLLRGAGLAGLKGMPMRLIHADWSSEIALVRPLLGWSRAETLAWCAARGLGAVDDPSNADLKYTRNRIRHELLPLLETYNPNIRRGLARTAAALGGDAEILSGVVERARQDALRDHGAGWAAYDLTFLRRMEEGLLRGVLRQALADLRQGQVDIDFDDIVHAAAFARRPSASGASELAAGMRMFVEMDRLILEKDGAAAAPEGWAQLAGNEGGELAVPGVFELAAGWRLQAERMPSAPGGFASAPANEAWLDAGLLPARLAVRPARAGERIQPLGMAGKSQKLSDLWVNAQVARRARERYPLVCAGEDVVWVPGLRLAEPYRVTADTRAFVRLMLIRGSIG